MNVFVKIFVRLKNAYNRIFRLFAATFLKFDHFRYLVKEGGEGTGPTEKCVKLQSMLENIGISMNYKREYNLRSLQKFPFNLSFLQKVYPVLWRPSFVIGIFDCLLTIQIFISTRRGWCAYYE